MQTYLIKAVSRATSKTLLIRAKNSAMALKKVARFKEHRDNPEVEFILLETRPDDRLKAI